MKTILIGGTYHCYVARKLQVVEILEIDGDTYKVKNLHTGRTAKKAEKDFVEIPFTSYPLNSATPETAPTLEAEGILPVSTEEAREIFAPEIAASTSRLEASQEALIQAAESQFRETLTPGLQAAVTKEAPMTLAEKLRAAAPKATTEPHVIVVARAGTGKTTTLVEGLKRVKGIESKLIPSPQQAAVWEAMEQSKGKVRTICFAAFNKSIATELQSRVPAGCDAMTMHSMGLKAVTAAFGRVKIESYRVSNLISEILERDIRELRKNSMILLKATEDLVGLCKMNLTDADDREELDKLASHYQVDLNGSRDKVFDLVPRVLEACKDPKRDGMIDFDDMIWLPVVLGLPVFRYDLLLVDEAQDLNRCQQALAKAAGKRLILCGDPCQPPGTMVTLAGTPGNRWQEGTPGKRIPIEELKEGDMLVGYSPKDGRNYSNRVVNGISVNPFSGELIEVETEEGVKTRYTPQHHCYASFGSLRDCYAVYLMKRGLQFRIGSCQLNYKASGNGLVHRLRTEGGDASWILEIHATKREARLREMELSYEYGIPQIVFANGNEGYILDDEGVSRFWDFVGNNAKKGMDVLKRFKLEWSRPVAVAGQQWQQSFKRPAIFAAANLVTGMEVRTEEGRWVRIKVKRVPYSGPVYSLSVSHDQLYMADGIVTHNCQAIYGFAGADAESMSRMARELEATTVGCVTLPLTVTRRCGKAIVEEAKRIVPNFEAFETNGEGKVSRAVFSAKGTTAETYHKLVNDGDMVLCRVNAPLVSECFRFLKAGRKAIIRGRDIGQGLISTVKKMKADNVADLIGKLSDWLHSEVTKENAKRNPSESKIIGLQDRFDCLTCFAESATTVDGVIAKIESVFSDTNGSGIVLSSVHKAKGLEADRVFLLQPEKATIPHPMARTKWQVEQEWNLLYVATTRAKNELVYVS